eukprot:8219584-Ditylum_brightwellii.AAC.1
MRDFPATDWFDIAEIKTQKADVVSNVVEITWLTRYPYPTQVVLDRGTEFMTEFTNMIPSDYGVKKTHHNKKSLSKQYY